MDKQKEHIKERMKNGSLGDDELGKGLQRQYDVQLEELDNEGACDCEVVCFPGMLDLNSNGEFSSISFLS